MTSNGHFFCTLTHLEFEVVGKRWDNAEEVDFDNFGLGTIFLVLPKNVCICVFSIIHIVNGEIETAFVLFIRAHFPKESSRNI